ncbi:BRI1 kinase inhibitor 1 [Heracleum sosnowskyi]|uniref:BRI1 kinase inhibitor 1 n=1 Tax=Heracleum sosnowskyi TaxID=360622 RepID=A0AAD8JJQ8_9APIA|nr:BRI1 kinase inhibitor 1 [Heracleum sosnowskyi]
MEIQDFEKNSNKSNNGELPTLVASPSPPSSSSNSPAHEFSFTISFQQQHSSNTINNNNSSINSPQVSAVDLSPADDIFFHGHLLPLQLLSHLPVSPRSSTNSLESFCLPITELFFDDHDQIIQENSTNDDIEFTNFQELSDTTRGRVKSKSFSIFGGRKKGSERQDQERQKKKLKSEVSDVLKKYMKMLRPLLPFRGSRKSINKPFHNQSYSFPGSVSSRKKQDELRGRRGLFSAPASMRTSPANSGLLVATGAMAGCSTSDSTMEELQAAIQSAITHCKNSIAVQEKIKCEDD